MPIGYNFQMISMLVDNCIDFPIFSSGLSTGMRGIKKPPWRAVRGQSLQLFWATLWITDQFQNRWA